MHFYTALCYSAVLASALLSSRIEAHDKLGLNLCTIDNSDDLSLHPDFVPSLPGYNQPLPSPWFSGFLDYEFQGRTVHTHYVLVLAQEDYDNDKPIIYWSNGGPGASSLFGLLTEVGPLMFSNLSYKTDDYAKTGIPTPIYNPYTWSQLGNILIIDQPAPVGFSYCNDDFNATDCAGLSWTDELTAQNAHMALQTFFKDKFPCLNQLPVFLTGESYGGIYIPTLAREILNDSDAKSIINLQGWAVGDGCLGTETGICGIVQDESYVEIWQVLFLAGHGQMPMNTFSQIMHACYEKSDTSDDTTGFTAENWKSTDKACQAAVSKGMKQVGGFFEYSLYDECTYDNGLMLALTTATTGSASIRGGLNDYPCGGYNVMVDYLSMHAVKKALHVEHASYYSTDNADGFDYTTTEKDLRPWYREVLKHNPSNLRTLIYNGDADPAITSLAAENWTSHLELTESQGWRPWTVDGCQRVGGYVTRYQEGLDFLTIRGAGHMVPTYKAEATYTFIEAWIKNIDYPTYDAKCEGPTAQE